MSLVRIAAFAALLLWIGVATAASLIVAGRVGVPPTFPLVVANGVLKTQSGTPYLIFGDSPQGANSLPLCSAGNTYALCFGSTDALPANATFVAYIKDRQVQGFNSIWINILCEQYTSCNNNGSTQEGTFPFTAQLSGTGYPGGSNYTTDTCPENGNINATPNDMDCWDMSSGINANGTATGANAAYWTHIDGYFKIAAQLGMQVFAGPISTDACNNRTTNAQSNGAGSIAWMYANNSTLKPANSNLFADFLYARYGNPASANYAPNLVWWVGNDYNCWDSVNRSSHFLPGIDNVVFSFASRLKTDEAASAHPHIMISAIDGLATSFSDTVNPWQNILNINGTYYVGAMYDGGLLAHSQNSTTIPPMIVEDQYAAEDFDGIDDGTVPPTPPNITGCDQQSLGGTNALQGDPNTCPFRERAQFWQFVLAGGYAGYLGGNHYTWTFSPGWNNGTVTGGGNACTGTSGAGHSPCLDVVSNANLASAVAFLKNNIAWYNVIPDATRVPDSNGYGTGTWAASPLVLAAGCYPTNNCAQYYIGQSYAHINDLGLHRGTLQNLMPVSGVTSDGLAGIVYVTGINSSCTYYSNFSVTNCGKAGGQQFTVNNAKITGASGVTAAWYDPSGPMTSPASIVCSPSGTPCSATTQVYTSPAASSHTDTATSDWVLLLTSSGSVGPTPTAFLSAANLETPTLNSGVNTTIPNGGSATLTWDSTNASSCTSADFTTGNSPGIGTITVSPTTTKTYHLTCGTASATALVTVSGTRRDAAASFCAANGGGSGSSGSPWHDACVIAAVAAATSGDTIFLAAGNWALNTQVVATFTGVISGTTLTVSGVTGTIKVGQNLADPNGNLAFGTQIIGGSGTSWTVNISQNITSEAMQTGNAVIIPNTKAINLVGAGSGNTFDTFGHPNNGSPTVLTAPTSQGGQTVTRLYTTGADQTVNTKCGIGNGTSAGLPGGYLMLAGTNQTVSHIFFDGSTVTAGGGPCGTIVAFQATNPTFNDIRALNYNNSNDPNGDGSEAQFALEQINGATTVMNSIVAQPILLGNPTFCSAASLQATTAGSFGASVAVNNTYFYQSNFNPIAFDSITFTRSVIFNSTDSFCTTGETPGTGPSGGALGPAANAPANGTGSGNYHFTFTNNYFSMGGQLYGLGGGINDPNTNGGVSDLNVTGNWFVGQQVAIDSCGLHYYDPTGGWSFRNPSFPDYYACAPTDINGGGMQINATWQPFNNNCAASTSDPPNKDNVSAGYGFNSSNNSLIATSSAQLVATGTGITPCFPTGYPGNPAINHTNTVANFRANKNYLSSAGSNGNLYVHDATTLNPSVTNNFCAGTGTFTQTDSTTCATTGFTTPPTASFTLGTLSGSTIPFASTAFTAQYGAVKWIASTSSTPPTSGDGRWSFLPPVSLSSVAHGNTVYVWAMDSANNIGAATPVALP